MRMSPGRKRWLPPLTKGLPRQWTPRTPHPTAPDTIVLIHGFWVTPRSWEHWITRYESQGFKVIAPAYPGFEVEVEALNADPTPVADLTIAAIIDKLESVIGALDTPPILMGHSAGGAFMQVVMDHGFGAAGVALNSGADRGHPIDAVVAAALGVPGPQEPPQPPSGGGLHARAVDVRVHEHLHRGGVPGVLRALRHPRITVGCCSTVCWPTSNPDIRRRGSTSRTTSGHHCCSCPAARTTSCRLSVQASNAKHYKSSAITERDVYEGRPHLMVAGTGWEEIADRALAWAVEHAVMAPTSSDRLSGRRSDDRTPPDAHRRADGAARVRGWRILTDPTFDRPGRTYRFGWGTSSRKVSGPAIDLDDIGPVDAVLLTHEHHADNLDEAGRTLLPGADVVLTTVSGARRLGRERTRARDVGHHTAGTTGTSGDRRHGDAVSPRATRFTSDRRRRDRLLVDVARPGTRIRVDLGRHRPVRRGPRSRRSVQRRHGGVAPRRREVPDHRSRPVHDDGERRNRTRRDPPADHGDPGPLRGLVALPPGSPRDRASTSRAPRPRSAPRSQWATIGEPLDLDV